MRKSILTSAVIILITAMTGVSLWMTGYPPEKEGLSQSAQQIRDLVTFPLFWAGFSTVFASIFIWFKRERLEEPAGKAGRIPAMGVQLPALLGLLFQILVPLDLFDVVSKAETMAIFFYFLSATFFTIGNFIATVPFESKIGFRTSATLSDKTVWSKSHRFLGRNMVILALITLPLPWMTSGLTAQWLLIGLVTGLKGLTWLFARRLAARQRPRGALPQ